MKMFNPLKCVGLLLILIAPVFFSSFVYAHTGSYCDPWNPGLPAEHVVYKKERDYGCDGSYTVRYYFKEPRESGLWVCAGYPIPTGYVVTQTADNYDTQPGIDCSVQSDYGPREYIKVPGDGDWICELTNMPEGHGISEKSYNQTTTGCENVGYRLRKLVDTNETLCDQSPIPTTYVATNDVINSSKCDSSASSSSGPAMVVTKMPVPPSQWVCSLKSPDIPPGWENYIKTEVGSSSNCEGTGTAYKIALIDNVNYTCDTSSMGPTIVATQALPEAGCYSIFDLATLGVGQSQSFCRLGRPVPSGFVVTEKTSNSSKCGSFPEYLRVTNPDINSNYVMCKGFDLPDGFAVTGDATSHNCGSLGAYTISAGGKGWYCVTNDQNYVVPDQMVIRSIQSGSTYSCASGRYYRVDYPNQSGDTDICLNKGIPENYVITRFVTNDTNCDGLQGSTIRIPSESTVTRVCSNSNIPTGYVIQSSGGNYSSCSGLLNDTYYDIKKLTASSDVICGIPPSYVPDGYVVTARYKLTECNSVTADAYNAMKVVKPNANGDTAICYLSPVPAGFARVEKISLSDCHSLIANSDSKIRYIIGSSGPHVICYAEDVPPNWEIIGELSSGDCKIKIAPIDTGSGNGSITPTEFVDPENEIMEPVNYNCGTPVNDPAFLISNPNKNSVVCP